MFKRVVGKTCKYPGFTSCARIVDVSQETCQSCDGGELRIVTATDKRLVFAAGLAVLVAVMVTAFLIWNISSSPTVNARPEMVERNSPPSGEANIVKLLRSIYSDGVKDAQEQAKLEEASHQLSIKSIWLSKKEEEIRGNSNKMLSSLKSGLKHAAREDYSQAEKEFRYCVEIDPENSFAWINLAAADIKTGKLEQAKHACDQAITIDPHSWIAHYNMGSLYAIRGDKENAIRELSEALRLASQGQSPPMTKTGMSQQIRRDRSFDSLQKDRRFQMLISRN